MVNITLASSNSISILKEKSLLLRRKESQKNTKKTTMKKNMKEKSLYMMIKLDISDFRKYLIS